MGVRISMLFRSKQCQRNLNLESHDKLDDASLNAMRCIQLGARPPQVLISPLGPRACQVYFTGAGPLLNTQGFACFGNPQQLVGNLNELKFQARERIAAGVVTTNSIFLLYSTIAEIRATFHEFGPQKGRWARNDPFPLTNGLFLVYSTVAEIRCHI